MIKLCLLCSNVEIGGLEKTLVDLCERLDPSRFNVRLCLLRNHGRFHDLIRNRFPEKMHACNGMMGGIGFLRSASFDLIHSFGLRGDFVSRLPGITKQAKLLSYVANPDLPHSRIRKMWNAGTSSRVDCYWADSEYRSNAAARRTAVPKDKIQVIYDGIDVQQFSANESNRDEIRTELKIPETSRLIGCVGNLRRIKGHAFLIHAIPDVLRKHPDTSFVFVGADFTGGEIPALAGKLGVSSNVKFLGFHPDVASIVNLFDVFVHPSLSDGLPRSVLEAMALEKPAIATKVGGIPEIIEDGVDGLLISPGDARALAEKMLHLLENPDLCRTLGRAARAKVERKFDLTRTIAKFEKMYRTLAET